MAPNPKIPMVKPAVAIVVLEIKYDAGMVDHPADWNWADVIDCDSDDVTVIASGNDARRK